MKSARRTASKKSKQLEMADLKGWGGKRRGAGRKNRSQTVNHMKREEFSARSPLHITMKLKDGLPSLRSPRMLLAFQNALSKAKAHGLRVIHYSLEPNHFHLFVECAGNNELSISMKSFGASFGKAVRKVAGGSGSVFKGRYHVSVLRNPTQARNGLAYVLLNRFKHERSHVDDNPYSSWKYFEGWRKLVGRGPRGRVERELPEYLHEPSSWLARAGWQKASHRYELA